MAELIKPVMVKKGLPSYEEVSSSALTAKLQKLVHRTPPSKQTVVALEKLQESAKMLEVLCFKQNELAVALTELDGDTGSLKGAVSQDIVAKVCLSVHVCARMRAMPRMFVHAV